MQKMIFVKNNNLEDVNAWLGNNYKVVRIVPIQEPVVNECNMHHNFMGAFGAYVVLDNM
jgi:hypothetical protein